MNWDDNPDNIRPQSAERIKEELGKIKEYIDYDVQNCTAQVTYYNGRLEAEARQVFRDRKGSLLKQANLVQALGIPLKKARTSHELSPSPS